MTKMITVVAILLCVLAVVPAMADDPLFDKGVTEYKFEDEQLLGDIVGPASTGVVVRKSSRSKSLIKVRLHFVPEMIKSVQDI